MRPFFGSQAGNLHRSRAYPHGNGGTDGKVFPRDGLHPARERNGCGRGCTECLLPSVYAMPAFWWSVVLIITVTLAPEARRVSQPARLLYPFSLG